MYFILQKVHQESHDNQDQVKTKGKKAALSLLITALMLEDVNSSIWQILQGELSGLEQT